MKKRIFTIILLVSLAISIIINALLLYRISNFSSYEQEYLNEIKLSIKKFEDYTELLSQSSFTVGVAHLYCAWDKLNSINKYKAIQQQSDIFYELWNIAALYPELFIGSFEEIIPILEKYQATEDIYDSEIINEIQAFNEKLRKLAKKNTNEKIISVSSVFYML